MLVLHTVHIGLGKPVLLRNSRGDPWTLEHLTPKRLEDGSYELSVPYGRTEELMMDILKYGPDVEVIGPPELRDEVALRLKTAAECYAG